MKRLSADKREFQIRFLRLLRKKLARKKARKHKSIRCQNKVFKKTKTIRISAPVEFSLNHVQIRKELTAFIERIREYLFEGLKVQINFNKTERLLPCGTLFFAASIEELLEQFPGKIGSNYPKNNTVEQLFQHINLLEKLGNSSRLQITADNVKYWYYITGTCTDLSSLKELFEVYSQELDDPISSGLYDSVSEAITNTINHAFPQAIQQTRNKEKRWWMFASKHDGKLEVAVYDMGIGIPKSLRSKPQLRDFFAGQVTHRHRKDAYLIEVAIESPRTVTRLPHRGKGLPEMLEFAQQGGIGGFTVYSAKGSYFFDAKTAKHTVLDLEPSIQGTLIIWGVPLN